MEPNPGGRGALLTSPVLKSYCLRDVLMELQLFELSLLRLLQLNSASLQASAEGSPRVPTLDKGHIQNQNLHNEHRTPRCNMRGGPLAVSAVT